MISPLLTYTNFNGQSYFRLSQSARIKFQKTAHRGRCLKFEAHDCPKC